MDHLISSLFRTLLSTTFIGCEHPQLNRRESMKSSNLWSKESSAIQICHFLWQISSYLIQYYDSDNKKPCMRSYIFKNITARSAKSYIIHNILVFPPSSQDLIWFYLLHFNGRRALLTAITPKLSRQIVAARSFMMRYAVWPEIHTKANLSYQQIMITTMLWGFTKRLCSFELQIIISSHPVDQSEFSIIQILVSIKCLKCALLHLAVYILMQWLKHLFLVVSHRLIPLWIHWEKNWIHWYFSYDW